METIEIPIGPNMSIDGGPFNNFVADGIDGETDPDSGTLVDVESGLDAHVDLVEEAVRTEVLDAQPFMLSTGDVSEEESNVGTIDVPLKAGYTIEFYSLKGEWDDLGNLEGNQMRKRSFEKKARNYGAMIQG